MIGDSSSSKYYSKQPHSMGNVRRWAKHRPYYHYYCTCSLEMPDRINRTILLCVNIVFEYGPIELTTPIICVGVGCPLRTQLSCLWAIRNSILRSKLRISALVQECFDSKRIHTKPAIISASGLIGKLNPKASTTKSSGFENFGSNFTMGVTSMLKSGMVTSPFRMLLTQLMVCTVPSISA